VGKLRANNLRKLYFGPRRDTRSTAVRRLARENKTSGGGCCSRAAQKVFLETATTAAEARHQADTTILSQEIPTNGFYITPFPHWTHRRSRELQPPAPYLFMPKKATSGAISEYMTVPLSAAAGDADKLLKWPGAERDRAAVFAIVYSFRSSACSSQISLLEPSRPPEIMGPEEAPQLLDVHLLHRFLRATLTLYVRTAPAAAADGAGHRRGGADAKQRPAAGAAAAGKAAEDAHAQDRGAAGVRAHARGPAAVRPSSCPPRVQMAAAPGGPAPAIPAPPPKISSRPPAATAAAAARGAHRDGAKARLRKKPAADGAAPAAAGI
ncbi:MAG: hypothetical protein BJ554DRAFT_5789, partial [Olpidium bornovanus]